MALKLLGRTGRVRGIDARIGELLRIGAGEDNDCRIVASGVSRQHARVVRDGDSYWLEDVNSTNGTFLNGQRIRRERLSHLDVVTLGRDIDLIAVSTKGETVPPVSAVEDAWLEPIDADTDARVDIPLGELTIGRLAPSNLTLDSPIVSSQHARIRRMADHVIIQDLKSANGTFINGQMLTEPTMLRDGDKISIAGTRHFRVRIVGLAKRVEPAAMVASQTVVFDEAWKTRLMWSEDEMEVFEAARRGRVAYTRPGTQRAAAAAIDKVASPAPVKPAAPRPPASEPSAPARQAEPLAKSAPPAAAKPAPPPAVRPAPPPPPPAPRPEPPAVKPAPPPAPPPAQPPVPPPAPAVGRPPISTSPDAPTAITHALSAVKLSGTHGTHTLKLGRHTIGRSETSNVVIRVVDVSRQHAAVTVGLTGAHVEDLGSANGTFVNGTQVPPGGAPLKTNDVVKFGVVEFKVELIS